MRNESKMQKHKTHLAVVTLVVSLFFVMGLSVANAGDNTTVTGTVSETPDNGSAITLTSYSDGSVEYKSGEQEVLVTAPVADEAVEGMLLDVERDVIIVQWTTGYKQWNLFEMITSAVKELKPRLVVRAVQVDAHSFCGITENGAISLSTAIFSTDPSVRDQTCYDRITIGQDDGIKAAKYAELSDKDVTAPQAVALTDGKLSVDTSDGIVVKYEGTADQHVTPPEGQTLVGVRMGAQEQYISFVWSFREDYYTLSQLWSGQAPESTPNKAVRAVQMSTSGLCVLMLDESVESSNPPGVNFWLEPVFVGVTTNSDAKVNCSDHIKATADDYKVAATMAQYDDPRIVDTYITLSDCTENLPCSFQQDKRARIVLEDRTVELTQAANDDWEVRNVGRDGITVSRVVNVLGKSESDLGFRWRSAKVGEVWTIYVWPL